MIEKLKKRWNIDNNLSILAIILVFSINGSFATWVAKPITLFFGLSLETVSPFIFWPLRILIIFPIYQLTLPILGWFFGQFKFFWAFEKKFLSRLGLGFLFKEPTKPQ